MQETDRINRINNASHLVEDLGLRKDAEFFSNPSNRLNFLQALDYEDFHSIIQHVNARVRGFEPRDRLNAQDDKGTLPMMSTPNASEKPQALRAGFEAIHSYLEHSDDDEEQKLVGASMAMEALVIWVHPFNDGNGRTSRFIGKFIEDGTVDTDELVAETANRNSRMRMYDGYLRIDQGNIYKDQDLILDDDEIEELKKTEMPMADGITLSITRLLEDKSLQEQVRATTERYKAAA